jgi:hypothetical protein
VHRHGAIWSVSPAHNKLWLLAVLLVWVLTVFTYLTCNIRYLKNLSVYFFVLKLKSLSFIFLLKAVFFLCVIFYGVLLCHRVVLQLCFSALTLGPLVVGDTEVPPGLSSVPWLVYMLAAASPLLVFLINEIVKQQEIK